jgi:hypothetical protein
MMLLIRKHGIRNTPASLPALNRKQGKQNLVTKLLLALSPFIQGNIKLEGNNFIGILS